MINRRLSFVGAAVAMGIAAALANGCSSSSSPSGSGGSGAGAGGQPSAVAAAVTAPLLNGNYEWQGPGAAPYGIQRISFFKQSYSMWFDCTAGQTTGCFDYGALAVNADDTVSFTSALDGQVRTMPLKLGTTQAMTAPTTTQDLIVTDAGSLVGDDAGALVGDAGSLISLPKIVLTFGLGGDGDAGDDTGFCLICSLQAAAGSDGGATAGDDDDDDDTSGEVPGQGGYQPGPDETLSATTQGKGTGIRRDALHPQGLVGAAGDASIAPQSGNGSMVSNNGSTYDIWSHECHDAANYAVVTNPGGGGSWGIVSCWGDLALTSNAGHAFNYHELTTSHARFWNWGAYCTAKDMTSTAPPPVSSGDALACVQKYCGDQYHAPGSTSTDYPGIDVSTKTLPPGQKVKSASPENCVVETAAAAGSSTDPTQTAFTTCNSCCNTYASFWDVDPTATGQTQQMHDDYLNHCLSHCRGSFGQN